MTPLEVLEAYESEPRPALWDPHTLYGNDDNGEPLPGTDIVGWSLTSGVRLSFAQRGGGLLFHLSLFGDVMERGFEERTVTAEQVRDFAHRLLKIAGSEFLSGRS